MDLDTSALSSPDPATRAAAVRAVRFGHLKTPGILAVVLACCRDEAPVPGEAPIGDDPLSALLSPGAAAAPTVGRIAADRLRATGIPGDPASARALAEALAAPGPVGALPELAAELLGETRWAELPEALAAVVPPLLARDVPLFQAMARLPSAALPLLAGLAFAPLRPRLLQELLNHPDAHPLAVREAERAVGAGWAPTEAEAAELLAILAAWAEPATARLAAALRPRFPWAVLWEAVDAEEARPALRAWLEAGAPGAPVGLLRRAAEVLRQREPLPGFPIALLLRRVDDELGLTRAWGDTDPELAGLLAGWVEALARAEGSPDRGWSAARALIEAGHGDRARAALAAALAHRELRWFVPWDDALLLALARLVPEAAGAAILHGLSLDPEAAAVAAPALAVLPEGVRRAAVEAVLARAEAAPVEVARAGRGLVRESRRGVDVEALAPLVEGLGDPALAARLDAVLPVVRAG